MQLLEDSIQGVTRVLAADLRKLDQISTVLEHVLQDVHDLHLLLLLLLVLRRLLGLLLLLLLPAHLLYEVIRPE